MNYFHFMVHIPNLSNFQLTPQASSVFDQPKGLRDNKHEEIKFLVMMPNLNLFLKYQFL